MNILIECGRLTGHLHSARFTGQGQGTQLAPLARVGEARLTMRLYAAKPEVLDSSWNPPAVKRHPSTNEVTHATNRTHP
jgi:hypothetical protein